jgi:hypothetical protein
VCEGASTGLRVRAAQCVRPTNSEVWRTSLAEAVTPTIVDNYVLALSPSLNKLVAYKKDTGSLAWYTPAPYLYLTTITGASSRLCLRRVVTPPP